MKLKKNIGTPGRILRFSVALVLFAFAYGLSSWLLLIAALFTVFEAAFSWCVLYQLLGKNSCPIQKKKK